MKNKCFIKNQFPIDTPILDIKYNYLGLQYKNNFYLFKDWLNYTLAHYFAKLETTKSNINKFLFDLLIAPFIKKLSYKSVDKQIKKLLEIS